MLPAFYLGRGLKADYFVRSTPDLVYIYVLSCRSWLEAKTPRSQPTENLVLMHIYMQRAIRDGVYACINNSEKPTETSQATYVSICIQFGGAQNSTSKQSDPSCIASNPVILATLHTGKKQKWIEKTEDKMEYESVLDKKWIENNQSTHSLNHDMMIMERNKKNLLCEEKKEVTMIN